MVLISSRCYTAAFAVAAVFLQGCSQQDPSVFLSKNATMATTIVPAPGDKISTAMTTTVTIPLTCSPIMKQPGCCCLKNHCTRYDPLTQQCCHVRLDAKVCSKDQQCGGLSSGTVAECVDKISTAMTTTVTTPVTCTPRMTQPGCCCLKNGCMRYDPLTQQCCAVRLDVKVCSKEQQCGGLSWGTVAECVDKTSTAMTTTVTTGNEMMLLAPSEVQKVEATVYHILKTWDTSPICLLTRKPIKGIVEHIICKKIPLLSAICRLVLSIVLDVVGLLFCHR